MRRAVFLDRDGVINAMVQTPAGEDSPQRPEEFRLLAGAAEAVAELNQAGFPVIVVSNQPGTAKGKSTLELVDQTTRLMHELLAERGARLDGVYYCLHHPEARLDELRFACECRKPKPGLLLQAAREHALALIGSYMVGDRPADMLAGQAAGCTTILVGPGAHGRHDARPDHITQGLADAARWILQREALLTESTRRQR